MTDFEFKGLPSGVLDLILGQYEASTLSKVVYGRGSIRQLPGLLDSLKSEEGIYCNWILITT